jgi:hypothetical protein
MTVNRYNRSVTLAQGVQYGTSEAHTIVRQAIKNNELHVETMVLRGFERLDTLAGKLYGDSRYWWILAASSDIGWGLQVPPGTVILVPILADVLKLVG